MYLEFWVICHAIYFSFAEFMPKYGEVRQKSKKLYKKTKKSE